MAASPRKNTMSAIHAATARPQTINPALFGALATRPVGVEERRNMRARSNWPARLIDSAGVVNVGRVCDVSEGGFGVMSAVHLPVGALLDIALAVPKTSDSARSVPVRCRVRVNSCSFAGVQSRLGVTFLALPKESRIAIRNYILGHA